MWINLRNLHICHVEKFDIIHIWRYFRFITMVMQGKLKFLHMANFSPLTWLVTNMRSVLRYTWESIPLTPISTTYFYEKHPKMQRYAFLNADDHEVLKKVRSPYLCVGNGSVELFCPWTSHGNLCNLNAEIHLCQNPEISHIQSLSMPRETLQSTQE